MLCGISKIDRDVVSPGTKPLDFKDIWKATVRRCDPSLGTIATA
jgi:hypothetical protein